jgi:ribosomal protein S18 acetylase RimI-like enzyme
MARERDMPQPHWYLLLIGIEPKSQGQGLGSELLRPMLNGSNRLGGPCYLETEEPQNIRFYLKNGFEIIINGQMAGHTGVRFWTFRKMSEPQR